MYVRVVLTLFIVLFSASQTAEAMNITGDAVSFTMPRYVMISKDTTVVTDSNGSAATLAGEYTGLGKDEFGTTMIYVPAMGGKNSSLSTLYDSAGGVSFKNNTLVAPLTDGGGEHVADLIVTCEEMKCYSDGFYGPVTGAIVHTGDVNATIDGKNASCRLDIYLNDYIPGTSYSVAFIDDQLAIGALSDALSNLNYSIRATGPMIHISSDSGPESIGYVISAICPDGEWLDHEPGDTAAYMYYDNVTRTVPARAFTRGGSSIIEATSYGPGTIMLVKVSPVDTEVYRPSGMGTPEIIFTATALGVLTSALAYMIVRIKRKKGD